MLTKRSDNYWKDVSKALGGYEKLLKKLRETVSKSQQKVLDQVEEKIRNGEDPSKTLTEFYNSNPEFKKIVDKSGKSLGVEKGPGDSSSGYTKGQTLSGVGPDGEEVSGTYVKSVFGKPMIETSKGNVVLNEITEQT